MSFIDDVKICINTNAEIKGMDRNFLIETKVKPPFKVQLKTEGIYLLYDFEKLKDPYPFFSKTELVKGLNSIADYVLFTQKEDVLFVVVIELKNKNGDPRVQLSATKLFAEYLVDSVNRQCKQNYKVEFRGIAHSKLYRPPINLKKLYDNYKNAYITGDKLNLSNFLI